jgi:hypothetical protein
MESGHDVAGDVLQVIPRRPPSARPPEGGGTGSYRFVLPPERRKKLTRIVLGTVAACALILVAAGIVHLARPSNDADGSAAMATAAAPALPSPNVSPAATPAAAPAIPDAPQTGTLRLQKPLVAGKVWLDGQKMTVASATIACGTHQLKIGAHGHPRPVDVPCGGELKLSR